MVGGLKQWLFSPMNTCYPMAITPIFLSRPMRGQIKPASYESIKRREEIQKAVNVSVDFETLYLTAKLLTFSRV